MKQLSFKIPDSDLEFLKWWSNKTAEPMSSIYRNITLELFREWKITALLKEYSSGSIGFKQFCRLGNLSFQQATLLFEKHDIEPPISGLMDDYTAKTASKLNQLKE